MLPFTREFVVLVLHGRSVEQLLIAVDLFLPMYGVLAIDVAQAEQN